MRYKIGPVERIKRTFWLLSQQYRSLREEQEPAKHVCYDSSGSEKLEKRHRRH